MLKGIALCVKENERRKNVCFSAGEPLSAVARIFCLNACCLLEFPNIGGGLQMRSGASPCSASHLTRALPMTTPSARRAKLRTWAGVEMPKPTATGRSVHCLIRRISGVTEAATGVFVPVTPVTEMK